MQLLRWVKQTPDFFSFSCFIGWLQVIRNHPNSLTIYKNKLLESGQVAQEDIERIQSKVVSILNEEFLASKDYVPQRRDWLSSHWSGFKSPEQLSRIRNTGYSILSISFTYTLIFLVILF